MQYVVLFMKLCLSILQDIRREGIRYRLNLMITHEWKLINKSYDY